ncbi:hypothetical protein AX16_007510 [Volvariella volvacea WC 439]|nr:hypothetical protein AX16_007510 [Volvariella volvacea WC 439]
MLPQDIIDSIIDELAEDSDALKACSLVAQSFVYPSRRHLFHHIHLPLFHTRLDSMLAILSACPRRHLSLVRSLQLENLDTKFFDGTSLLNTIRSFDNLTRLEVQCRWKGSFDPVNSNAGLGNRDILRECCQPSITHLSLLMSPVIPPEEFYRCTSLAHLSLVDVGFLPGTEQGPVPLIPLKSLYIEPPLHPSCPWNLDQLEAFGFREQEPLQYKKFLSLIKTSPWLSVTSLAIGPPRLCEPLCFSFTIYLQQSSNRTCGRLLLDLSVMPNLACLTFSFFNFGSNPQQTLWLTLQLQKLHPSNQLHELHLWFMFSHYPSHSTQMQIQWERLDDCLTSDRFKKLKLVKLLCQSRYESSDEVIQSLPKTKEQKTLRVDVVRDAVYLNWNFPTLSRTELARL